MDTEFELDWQKSKDKQLMWLFWNKLNILDFSTQFFPNLSCAYDKGQVIEGNIT